MSDMILELLAVLDGGKPEAETRAEIRIPNGADADVRIVARIRDGRVALDIIGEVTNPKPADHS